MENQLHIDAYKFGVMTIDGTEYRKDLIIVNGDIIPNWWRKEGHLLQLSDMADKLQTKPVLFIIGTGKFGMMKVDPTLVNWLNRNRVQYRAEKTDNAVRKYNNATDKTNTMAAFHLTC